MRSVMLCLENTLWLWSREVVTTVFTMLVQGILMKSEKTDRQGGQWLYFSLLIIIIFDEFAFILFAQSTMTMCMWWEP